MKVLSIFCLLVLASVSHAFSMSSFHGAQLRNRVSSSNKVMSMEVEVEIGEDESVESALMRFKRAVAQSGHLQELKHRSHFETTQEKKKRKTTQARKQMRIARLNDRRFAGDM